MTAKPVASTKQLLRVSFDDEKSLQYPLPASKCGFHGQQAVEKRYKTLPVLRNGQYPFSLDIKPRRNRGEAAGSTPPACSLRLEDLSEYASSARYDDPIVLSDDTRLVLRSCIAELRSFALNQVQPPAESVHGEAASS